MPLVENDFPALCDSIDSYSGNIENLEEALLDHINDNDFNQWQFVGADVFRSCFIRGLNTFLLTLLTKGRGKEQYKNWGDNFQHTKNRTPLLMGDFKANEGVVIKVLKLFMDDFSSSLNFVLQETDENILHILLKRGMPTAVIFLIKKYDVSHLAFGTNKNHDIPLSLAIGRGEDSETLISSTNVAAAIWDYMVSCGDKKTLNMALTRPNQKG